MLWPLLIGLALLKLSCAQVKLESNMKRQICGFLHLHNATLPRSRDVQ